MDNYGRQIYIQMTLILSLVCCDMMNSNNCRICLYVNWNNIDVAILLQFSCIQATSVPLPLLLHLPSKSYVLLSECCLHKIVSPFYLTLFMMLPFLNTFTSWSCSQIIHVNVSNLEIAIHLNLCVSTSYFRMKFVLFLKVLMLEVCENNDIT